MHNFWCITVAIFHACRTFMFLNIVLVLFPVLSLGIVFYFWHHKQKWSKCINTKFLLCVGEFPMYIPCQFSRRYHLQQESYEGGGRTFWPTLVWNELINIEKIATTSSHQFLSSPGIHLPLPHRCHSMQFSSALLYPQ